MADGVTRFAHAPSLMMAEVGGDSIVMMDVDLAKYFGVEDVAADVWRLLEQPRSIDELVDALVEMYDVERQVCHVETSAFVEQMLADSLLVVADSAT